MAHSVVASTGQQAAAPVRKVWAGGLAGAVATVAIFILNTYVFTAKPLPAEVAAALTTIITFIVSYLVPPSPDEAVSR